LRGIFVRLRLEFIILMPCKKSELTSAINTYAAARVSGDINLINFGANVVGAMLDTLEFSSEDDAVEKAEEVVED